MPVLDKVWCISWEIAQSQPTMDIISLHCWRAANKEIYININVRDFESWVNENIMKGYFLQLKKWALFHFLMIQERAFRKWLSHVNKCVLNISNMVGLYNIMHYGWIHKDYISLWPFFVKGWPPCIFKSFAKQKCIRSRPTEWSNIIGVHCCLH